jgi:hypothetical protein
MAEGVVDSGTTVLHPTAAALYPVPGSTRCSLGEGPEMRYGSTMPLLRRGYRGRGCLAVSKASRLPGSVDISKRDRLPHDEAPGGHNSFLARSDSLMANVRVRIPVAVRIAVDVRSAVDVRIRVNVPIGVGVPVDLDVPVAVDVSVAADASVAVGISVVVDVLITVIPVVVTVSMMVLPDS